MLNDSLALRVGGGFAILVAGAVGIILPLALRSINDARAAPAILVLKAFAAGVILALALVHLLQEAYVSLSSLPKGTLYNNFPITGVFVCIGILIMFIAERLSLDFISSGGGAVACGDGASSAASESVNVADVEAPMDNPVHSHEHLVALTAAREAVAAGHGGHDHAAKPAVKDASVGEVAEPHAHHHHHANGHAHPGMLSIATAADSVSSTAAKRRRVLIAHLLEFSIVLHSIIIGLNLGTTSGPHDHSMGGCDSHAGETAEEHAAHGRRLLILGGSSSAVAGDAHDHDHAHGSEHDDHAEETPSLRPIVVLVIVLCFHQLFEGIALGSYIAELKDAASRLSKFVMGAIFALTVPVGTWVGIAVADTYEPESVTGLWVTGSLNALTGGMLLYNALITFLAEEFTRDDLGAGAVGRALKRKMYAATVMGAACMALLGIWA